MVEENFARLPDEGTFKRDIDRGAALSGARSDKLNVMHHGPRESGGGKQQECER
jgi:hypothetical protein